MIEITRDFRGNIEKYQCGECGKYFFQRSRYCFETDKIVGKGFWISGQSPIITEKGIFCKRCYNTLYKEEI